MRIRHCFKLKGENMKDVDKKIKDLEQLLLSIVNDKDINC